MAVKIMSILLIFFIFVIVNRPEADNVKSTKNTANQGTVMKIDENRAGVQKGIEPARKPATSLKKLKPRFQSTMSHPVANHEMIPGSRTEQRVNFLMALEQKKKLHLLDSLQKVIYSHEFFKDLWRDKFLRSAEANDTRSADSNFRRTAPNRYLNPDREKYFEEGEIQSTLKLLQSRREEIFNEIFVGFRFSFGAKNTRMLPEMKISPSFEKGAGFIIAF